MVENKCNKKRSSSEKKCPAVRRWRCEQHWDHCEFCLQRVWGETWSCGALMLWVVCVLWTESPPASARSRITPALPQKGQLSGESGIACRPKAHAPSWPVVQGFQKTFLAAVKPGSLNPGVINQRFLLFPLLSL